MWICFALQGGGPPCYSCRFTQSKFIEFIDFIDIIDFFEFIDFIDLCHNEICYKHNRFVIGKTMVRQWENNGWAVFFRVVRFSSARQAEKNTGI